MLRQTFVAVAIFGAGISVAAAETPVERGSYLVNAVMACDGCHTPRTPSGFVHRGRQLADFIRAYLARR